MRLAPIVVACVGMLGLACGGAAQGSSNRSSNRNASAHVEARPQNASDELRALLGDAIDADVRAVLDRLGPALDDPLSYASLSTLAGHARWVDETLEPWRARRREARSRILDVWDRASARHDVDSLREALVFEVVIALLEADTARGLAAIPVPAEVREDPSAVAEWRQAVGVVASEHAAFASVTFRSCLEELSAAAALCERELSTLPPIIRAPAVDVGASEPAGGDRIMTMEEMMEAVERGERAP